MLIRRYLGGGEEIKVFAAEGEHCVQATLTKAPEGTVGLLVVNCKDTFDSPLNTNLRHLYDSAAVQPTAKARHITTGWAPLAGK